MNIDKFLGANVPEAIWKDCFITGGGIIFQPSMNENGSITKTARAIYEEYLNLPPLELPNTEE